MLLEQAIVEALTGYSPRTAAGSRVYAVLAPEAAALPRLTYQRISTAPVNSLSGHCGLDSVTIQIDCWASTKEGAAELAREVRYAMADGAFKALPQNEADVFDIESRLYRHTVDFTCWDKSF